MPKSNGTCPACNGQQMVASCGGTCPGAPATHSVNLGCLPVSCTACGGTGRTS